MPKRTIQLIAALLATVPALAMPAPPPKPVSLDAAEQSRLEQAARATAGDLGIRSIWAYRATDSSPIQADVVHEYFFSAERYKKYKTNTCVREQNGWKCQGAEIVTPYIGNSTPEPLLPEPLDVEGITKLDSGRYRITGRYRGGYASVLVERRNALFRPPFKATLHGVIYI